MAEKIAVLAPMASASVRTATTKNPGFFEELAKAVAQIRPHENLDELRRELFENYALAGFFRHNA
jgi:hypothetical protein